MINKSKFKEHMPTLPAKERVCGFKEVELGLSDESALKESLRCLNCKNKPCVANCPIGVNIPGFIKCVSSGDIKKAYEIISQSNFFPCVCGRVCPQEKQCEAACVRAKTGESVSIGYLERYVADKFMQENLHFEKSAETTDNISCKKVAVVGSGPSGLVCAGELAKKGYKADVFEALHDAGGVLAYGIPAFRLPREILETELKKLKKIGVNIIKNVIIGKTLTIDDLFSMGYGAVYIATGAGLPKLMNIPGENLSGVYFANEFLTRINLMKAYKDDYETPICIPKKVIVIGGGNVAMDVARSAVRLGAQSVKVVYRKSENDMPARKAEILHAKEEGVEFMFLKTPTRFFGENGKAEGIKYLSVAVERSEENNLKIFKIQSEQEFEERADCIIVSVGNGSNRILLQNEREIKCREDGRILVNECTLETSKKDVYAGGDAVTGAATVIMAMAAGKKAAMEIDKRISEINI